jgi:hypothetical protein
MYNQHMMKALVIVSPEMVVCNKIFVQDLEMNVLLDYQKMFEKILAKKNERS